MFSSVKRASLLLKSLNYNQKSFYKIDQLAEKNVVGLGSGFSFKTAGLIQRREKKKNHLEKTCGLYYKTITIVI